MKFLSPIARQSLRRKVESMAANPEEKYKGTGQKRTVYKNPAISDIIERAPTIAHLKFARRQIEGSAFAGASEGTRFAWRKRLDERVLEMIVTAVSASDVCYAINTTFSIHEWPTADSVKEIWRRAAELRIKEIETHMSDQRTDAERAEFIARLNEAEIALLHQEVNFVNRVREPAAMVAKGEVGEFDRGVREGIDVLFDKYAAQI